MLPQGIENADIAIFCKFDVEAAAGWVGINGVGFWCNYLFNLGDITGAWEGDVVNPGAVAARLSIVVLDVEPFEHMTSGFEIKLSKGPVILARPPVFSSAIHEEGEDVLVVFGRGLIPETDFPVIKDVGIDNKLGDLVIADIAGAGTEIAAMRLLVSDKPMLIACVLPFEETEVAAFKGFYC